MVLTGSRGTCRRCWPRRSGILRPRNPRAQSRTPRDGALRNSAAETRSVSSPSLGALDAAAGRHVLSRCADPAEAVGDPGRPRPGAGPGRGGLPGGAPPRAGHPPRGAAGRPRPGGRARAPAAPGGGGGVRRPRRSAAGLAAAGLRIRLPAGGLPGGSRRRWSCRSRSAASAGPTWSAGSGRRGPARAPGPTAAGSPRAWPPGTWRSWSGCSASSSWERPWPGRRRCCTSSPASSAGSSGAAVRQARVKKS